MVTTTWKKWYSELVEFRSKYPNRWPIRRGRETKLAAWCSRQRSLFNKGNLSKNEIQMLNKINFPWVSQKKNLEKWMKKYRELVNFKKKFPEGRKWPHARMQNNKYIELGKWVGYQRALYKKKQLEKEKIDLLNKIPFDFEPTRYIDDNWKKMLHESVTYYKKKGYWPPRIQPIQKGIKWGYTKEELILGDWCYKQRWNKRRGQLSTDKINLLNKHNFDWKKYKVQNYDDESWERNFYKLKKFWDKNPNRNPQPYNPSEKSLHNFWEGQKRAYKRGSLTKYRIKKLKKINFSFDTRKYGKYPGRSEWDKIILKGENERIEFKSSLRWDYKKNTKNVELECPIIKTICALLNSQGGHLFIGVNDRGRVLGIESDYLTLGKKGNKDGFLLHLNNLINNYLGKNLHQYISTKIEKINGKEVCILIISHSKSPVYLRYKNKEEFCIRGFASSETLRPSQIVEYVRKHWRD